MYYLLSTQLIYIATKHHVTPEGRSLWAERPLISLCMIWHSEYFIAVGHYTTLVTLNELY